MAALLLLSGLFLTGCSVLDAEQHYRGGFSTKVFDEHVVKADSKSMRVLRAAAVLGILAEAATTNLQGVDAASAAINQMRATAYDIGVTFAVANTRRQLDNPAPDCVVRSGSTSLAGNCYDPTFDLHMKLVTDDLIHLAGISLPTKDLKRLLGAIEAGDYVSALSALFATASEIVDTTRIGFSGYRDMVDANGAIQFQRVRGPAQISFEQAYQHGEGSLAAYGPALDAYLGSNRPFDALLQAQESDFVPWFRQAKFVCVRAAWNLLYPPNAVTLRALTGLANKSACDLPADGFAAGLQDYQNGFSSP